MTNPVGTQWETAVLNKLTSNGERIALIENYVKGIKDDTDFIKSKALSNDKRLTEAEEILATVKSILKISQWTLGIAGTVLLSIIANFLYSVLVQAN